MKHFGKPLAKQFEESIQFSPCGFVSWTTFRCNLSVFFIQYLQTETQTVSVLPISFPVFLPISGFSPFLRKPGLYHFDFQINRVRPSLSHPHALRIELRSVNHASRIAPWSQSTLKWWKWIKLITDSHCESWQGIKSCPHPPPAVAHSSAVFYDGGESDQVPITFFLH